MPQVGKKERKQVKRDRSCWLNHTRQLVNTFPVMSVHATLTLLILTHRIYWPYVLYGHLSLIERHKTMEVGC